MLSLPHLDTMQGGQVQVPGACPYASYSETYRATERALASDEADALRAVAVAIEQLAGRQALVASTAAFDAVNQLPMRPRAHLCRLRLYPACGSSEECWPVPQG
jgi:hypothetical protein